MVTRDTQRKRVYDSERDADEAYTGTSHFTQTIPNAEVQPWIDAVMRRSAIRKRWGEQRIVFEYGRGGGRTYGGSTIYLGVGARNPWYILHEIAHCLMPRGYASHGPEFVGIYRFLIRTVEGEAASKALITAQRKHRVRSNNRAIPKPTVPVRTQAEKRERARTKAAQPVGRMDRYETARTIRRAVKAGQFGPAGRKPRIHALATARALEVWHQ